MTPNVDKTEVIARDELHLVGVWRGVPVVMFEGYRNGVFAVGLIIGVGMATASILWVFGLNYCPNQPCRYSSAAEDPSGDHERVWQFPNSMRGTFSYPMEPDLAEGRPKRYEYYDLRAQERMAHATDWIAWLTLVSSVISAFGLGALLYSLAQTKRAISDTREIGEAQVRAYLHCTSAKFICTENFLHVEFMLKNTGQSPATRIAVDAIAWVSVLRDEDATYMHVAKSTAEQERLPTIMSGGETGGEVSFYSSRSEIVENKPWPDIRAESAHEIFATANVAEIALTITWMDVFGIENVADCHLSTVNLFKGEGDLTVLMDRTTRKTGSA